MAYTILIPARMASSRLPRKPLADLGGKPMIVRCCERAVRSAAQRVVVATDHADIVTAVRQHGFEAVLTRADHPTGTDRLAEAADLLQLAPEEIVVNLQGDEPLIDPRLLDEVAQRLEARPDCVMGTAVHPLHAAAEFLSPAVVKVVLDAAGDAAWFSRAPLPWPRDAHATAGASFAAGPLPAGLPALRHIGLYAYRRHFLPTYAALAPAPSETWEALEQLRVLHHGYRIACVVTPEAPPGGVDTPDDLIRVRTAFDPPPPVG